MALTPETGAGGDTVDALIALAFANSYHTAQGNTAWAAASTDELREEAIRRASRYVSAAFTWEGIKTHGRDQVFEWPRTFVVDRDGYSILSDEVPVEIQRAVAEAALREVVTPGTLTPDFTPNKEQKRAKVGPIEVEYANTGRGASASRPVLTVIGDIVKGLTRRGSGSGLSGEAIR